MKNSISTSSLLIAFICLSATSQVQARETIETGVSVKSLREKFSRNNNSEAPTLDGRANPKATSVKEMAAAWEKRSTEEVMSDGKLDPKATKVRAMAAAWEKKPTEEAMSDGKPDPKATKVRAMAAAWNQRPDEAATLDGRTDPDATKVKAMAETWGKKSAELAPTAPEELHEPMPIVPSPAAITLEDDSAAALETPAIVSVNATPATTVRKTRAEMEHARQVNALRRKDQNKRPNSRGKSGGHKVSGIGHGK